MISPSLARMLAQEHEYKPITGNVITLGRQLIGMTHGEAITVLKGQGMTIDREAIEATRNSVESRVRYAEGMGYLTDQAFFRLFGLDRVYSFDVTDYEDCDIVHDLNKPIPDELKGTYDFIIDGGTFDHLVDIKQCFINVIDMLKPNGRIFMWNAASNFTGAAYLSFGPDFFEDYFVINRFNDTKVYIAEGESIGQLYDWDMYYFDSEDGYEHFPSDKIQMVIVMAEKASDATNDAIPLQAQYRDDTRAQLFNEGKARARQSARPILRGSVAADGGTSGPGLWDRVLSRLGKETPVHTVPKGFRYIGKI